MKAVRLSEVKELLSAQAFAAWWAEYGRGVAALKEARLRHEDLVAQAEMMELRSELAQRAAIDAFSRSGEAEDRGRGEQAEAQALENQALEHVAIYEEHRFRTSDLWYRLGGAEKRLEEAKEAAASATGAGKQRADAALAEAEKEHARVRGDYEAFDGRRNKLWEDVEDAWSRSCERALLAAEHSVGARAVRREAERLFKEAEERRTRAKALRAEADAAGRERADAERKRADLLRGAGERFGCLAGDGWLYWRNRDDKRAAFAVALQDLPEGANLEVKALAIYAVGLQRGIGHLDPARDGAAAVKEGAPPAPTGAA
ncbi:MAG: hypothetical protein U0229_11715 [Anaeromyxobacter sp.]